MIPMFLLYCRSQKQDCLEILLNCGLFLPNDITMRDLYCHAFINFWTCQTNSKLLISCTLLMLEMEWGLWFQSNTDDLQWSQRKKEGWQKFSEESPRPWRQWPWLYSSNRASFGLTIGAKLLIVNQLLYMKYMHKCYTENNPYQLNRELQVRNCFLHSHSEPPKIAYSLAISSYINDWFISNVH